MLYKDKEYGFCGIICSDCKNYKKNLNCQGCLGEKNLLNDCPTRSCAISKKINLCSECEKFPCEELYNFYNDGNALHKKAYQNIIEI